MPTVHIAGLSLSGNKGGPAILASLVFELKKHISPLHTVLISTNMEGDTPWCDYYDVELAPRPTISRREWHRWFQLYRGSDLAIDMHGVKFYSNLGWRRNLLAAAPLVVPRLMAIPSVAFTQTYGPFENYKTRLVARIALRMTNLLYAREPASLDILADIGLGKKATLYPEVALILPACPTTELTCSDTVKLFIAKPEPYICVTLSRKVIQEEKRLHGSSNYAELMREFIVELLQQNFRVLLVPHTYRPDRPLDNDHALTREVFETLNADPERCLMVDADLPPDQLKTLIAGSYVLVGSRYHSLVAALSSGVPVLAVGWSHKYDGLTQLFGLDTTLWSNQATLDDLRQQIQHLCEQREVYAQQIMSRLPFIQAQVHESIERVAQLLRPNP